VLVHVTVSPWAILSDAGENVKLPVISTVKFPPKARLVPADKRTSTAHKTSSRTFFASIFLDVRHTKRQFVPALDTKGLKDSLPRTLFVSIACGATLSLAGSGRASPASERFDIGWSHILPGIPK